MHRVFAAASPCGRFEIQDSRFKTASCSGIRLGKYARTGTVADTPLPSLVGRV
jgi:hypothetical protein